MKFSKSIFANIIFITIISLIYSLIFFTLSGHVEYTRIADHVQTLDSGLWNFIKTITVSGNIKYFSIPILVLATLIIFINFFKRRIKYDEFQFSIILKSLAISGIITIIAMPIMLILILSDRNYALEVIFLFSFIQWIAILISDFIFTLKY